MRYVNKTREGKEITGNRKRMNNLYSVVKAEKNGMMTATEYTTLNKYMNKLEHDNSQLKKKNCNLTNEISLLLDIVEKLIDKELKRKKSIENPFFNLELLNNIFFGV